MLLSPSKFLKDSTPESTSYHPSPSKEYPFVTKQSIPKGSPRYSSGIPTSIVPTPFILETPSPMPQFGTHPLHRTGSILSTRSHAKTNLPTILDQNSPKIRP